MCGGFADAGPLGVAKHVDQIQVGRNKRLKGAVGRQGFKGAAPVAETLTGTWQPDAPPMHAQDLGAKGDLLIDEPFGIGLPQELAHLDGSRLATLLPLPAKPRASKPPRGREESVPADIQAEHRRERRVELVGVNPSRHAEHTRDVFRPRACGT